MKTVELIKIFLASPRDVQTERNYVKEVVATINRTVAQDKNIRLEVKCSENAYPGYGKDGQAIINEQIGKMDEYDLFILIMKDRFGSPTKRHASGTVEEFTLARKAHKERGKPDIWFYSGSMKQDVKKNEDKQQQAKVKGFRTRYINKRYGLFIDYKNPSNFKSQLHDQLTLWLNDYSNKKPRKSSNTSKTKTVSPNKKEPIDKTKVANNFNQASLISSKPIKDIKSTTNKSKTTAKPKTNNSKSISNSGAWVLLDNNLFETKSVVQDVNRKLILNIPIINSEQETNLRYLQTNHCYGNRTVSYSYQNDASMVQLESIKTDSIKGKTSCIVTLKPIQQSNNYNIYKNYITEQIVELKIRFLLLNEIQDNQNQANNPMLNYMLTESSYSTDLEKFIFSDIWKKWKSKPKMFLINARLAAVHLLKSQNIVEHILKFNISLNQNVVSIDFRGKMPNIYANQEPKTLEVKGKCTL